MVVARSISFTFNAGSGAVSITGSIKSLIFSGTFTGSLALTTRTFHGALTLKTGMTVAGGSSSTTTFAGNFLLASTITSAGLTLDFPITINATGGTVTLADTFTSGSSGAWTLNTGTLNANNQNITIASFNSSNTNTRTITMGSGTWTLTQAAGWNTGTTTGLTFNVNTSTIVLSSNGAAFVGGGLTYRTVNFTTTVPGDTVSISSSNVFTNLSFAAPSSVGITTVSLAGNQTITGTLTVGGATATNRCFIRSSTTTITRTITAAAVSLQNTDFRDITASGTAAPFAGTNLGNAKGNLNITFASPKTVYWNLAGSQFWSATGWALGSGGTPAVNNFPLAQDTAVFDDTGSVGTVTINAPWNIGTIDMSNRTSAMTLSPGGNNPFVYGDWINGPGTTIPDAGLFTFSGRNNQFITSAGKPFNQSLVIDSIGGTVQILDNLTLTGDLVLTRGTFNANNQNVTTGIFNSSNSNTRTLTMGSGIWTLTRTGTVWDTSTTSLLTFNVNTANIVLSDTSTTTRTFNGGALTYNTITIGGTTGISSTFFGTTAGTVINTLASTKTVAHNIFFNANITIVNWAVTGTPGNIVTIRSGVVGTQRIITYTGSGILSMDYMSIEDLNFSYGLGATQRYKVYAGLNSINSNNNLGVLFQSTTAQAFLLTTGTSWTVPADWDNSSNSIHLIGAGGGGAASARTLDNRAAGGGGGGGGYTVLNNQTLTPGASVLYAIGLGTINVNGGNTTWDSGASIAGGGQRGTATTTPSSSGGAGGTGAFAGGTGGVGSFGTAASTGYGSGAGGGAGGPNGIGGNGGNGFASTTAGNISGGGGGGNGGGSNGTNSASGVGGVGGNNASGTGGSSSGNGRNGGGGGGGVGVAGGNGGKGIDVFNTFGGGGGAGGSGATIGTSNTATYGGGGSGSGVTTTGTTNTGSAGAQGAIFIIYFPGGAATNSNFFLFMPI
jgi:hypothetical protein